jgi:hypothetical protein
MQTDITDVPYEMAVATLATSHATHTRVSVHSSITSPEKPIEAPEKLVFWRHVQGTRNNGKNICIYLYIGIPVFISGLLSSWHTTEHLKENNLITSISISRFLTSADCGLDENTLA